MNWIETRVSQPLIGIAGVALLLVSAGVQAQESTALSDASAESAFQPNHLADPPSLFPESTASEAVPVDREVVFEVDFTHESALGAMEAFVDGLYLEMPDGSREYLDLESLEDSFGRAYSLVAESYQLGPETPTTHKVQVLRRTRTYATEAEIEEAFLEANPGATEADLAELAARRARAATVTAPTRLEDDPQVLEWLADAAASDTLWIRVRLRDPVPLELPRPSSALVQVDPVSWLLAMEERQLAIELRALEAEQRHLPIVEALPDGSWSGFVSGWVTDSFELVAEPAAVEALASHPEVLRIEQIREAELAANTGDEIRWYSQLDQLVDPPNGYDGDTGTGRSSNTEVYAMILDEPIDLDHPAWRDWYDPSNSYSRLVSAWQADPNAPSSFCPGTYYQPDTVGYQSGDSPHGNRVATQFVADLTDYQDPNVTGVQRQYKTGTTTETVFSVVQRKGTDGLGRPWEEAAKLAICLGVDIINLSLGDGSSLCALEHEEVDAVNAMFHDGIFVVAAAGNDESAGGACTVRPPGTAAGSFAVAGYEVQGEPDLDSSGLTMQSNPFPQLDSVRSSSGPDEYGRPLIKLTAAAGREGPHYVRGGGTYESSTGNGTSYAAPVVAGAAADVLDFIVTNHSPSFASEVGVLFAYLLAMGDGTLEGMLGMPGGTQVATTPIDSAWGAGRLKVRRFDEVGMDYPWRKVASSWTHDHGEVYTLPVNPLGGSNYPVSGDAEWFRGALWWYEPNLGSDGAGGLVDTSSVSYRVRRTQGSTSYTCASTVPQSQRLWLGSVIGGHTWETKVTGLSIPASDDLAYHHGEQVRRMFQVTYYEDRDRDDWDGQPPAHIE